MARPVWKFSFFSKSIWRKIILLIKSGKFKYKKNNLFDRSSQIPLCFKNKYVRIHKGNSIRRLLINKYVIGRKFGEFSFSRKPFHFPLRKKKGKFIRR